MEISGKAKEQFSFTQLQQKESPTSIKSIGQKLYDLVGAEIGREGGVTLMNKGNIGFQVNKDWGVSGWYQKKQKGMGFNRGNYDFGLSISRGI